MADEMQRQARLRQKAWEDTHNTADRPQVNRARVAAAVNKPIFAAGETVQNASKKAADSPVLPLLLMAAGGYLMWFAVKYWRDADVHWPSDPVKSVLQGHGLPARTPVPSVAAELAAAIQTAQAAGGAPAGGAPALPGTGEYTHSQLETIWKLAGGNPAKADLAAAIAQAESGGQPKVTSPNPDGGTNVGLWQLDTKGKGTGHTVAQLQNPATNAKVTVAASSNGADWSAWQTYAQGTYKQYLAGAPADQGSTVPTG